MTRSRSVLDRLRRLHYPIRRDKRPARVPEQKIARYASYLLSLWTHWHSFVFLFLCKIAGRSSLGEKASHRSYIPRSCSDLRFRGKDQRPNSQSIRWTAVLKPPDLLALRLAAFFSGCVSDTTTITLFINRCIRYYSNEHFLPTIKGNDSAVRLRTAPISVLFCS